MKNLIILFLFVIVMSPFFNGCYTIVWDPREEYTSTENSYEVSDDFYTEDYYGGYVEYYESPWWISIPVYVTYPSGTTDNQTKARNNTRDSDTENMRNSNGRGNTDRNPVITNTTPTTTTTNSGNTENSNVDNTPPPTRDSNSGSSNNSSTSTSETRNSGSNETRNSSGSRNSGSGRK